MPPAPVDRANNRRRVRGASKAEYLIVVVMIGIACVAAIRVYGARAGSVADTQGRRIETMTGAPANGGLDPGPSPPPVPGSGTRPGSRAAPGSATLPGGGTGLGGRFGPLVTLVAALAVGATGPPAGAAQAPPPIGGVRTAEARLRAELARSRVEDSRSYWGVYLDMWVDLARELHTLRTHPDATPEERETARRRLEGIAQLIDPAVRRFQDGTWEIPEVTRAEAQRAITAWTALRPHVIPAPTPAEQARAAEAARARDEAFARSVDRHRRSLDTLGRFFGIAEDLRRASAPPARVFDALGLFEEWSAIEREGDPAWSPSAERLADVVAALRSASYRRASLSPEQQTQLDVALPRFELELHRARVRELSAGPLPLAESDWRGAQRPGAQRLRLAESQDFVAAAEGRAPSAVMNLWREFLAAQRGGLDGEQTRLETELASLTTPPRPAAGGRPAPGPAAPASASAGPGVASSAAPSAGPAAAASGAPAAGAPPVGGGTTASERVAEIRSRLSGIAARRTELGTWEREAESEQRAQLVTLARRLAEQEARATADAPSAAGPDATPADPRTPAPTPPSAEVRRALLDPLDRRVQELGDAFRATIIPAADPIWQRLHDLDRYAGSDQGLVSRAERNLRRFRSGDLRTSQGDRMWTEQDYLHDLASATAIHRRSALRLAEVRATLAERQHTYASAYVELMRAELTRVLAARRSTVPPPQVLGPLGLPPEIERNIDFRIRPEMLRDWVLAQTRLQTGLLAARNWLLGDPYAPLAAWERAELATWARQLGITPIYERNVYIHVRRLIEAQGRLDDATRALAQARMVRRDAATASNEAETELARIAARPAVHVPVPPTVPVVVVVHPPLEPPGLPAPAPRRIVIGPENPEPVPDPGAPFNPYTPEDMARIAEIARSWTSFGEEVRQWLQSFATPGSELHVRPRPQGGPRIVISMPGAEAAMQRLWAALVEGSHTPLGRWLSIAGVPIAREVVFPALENPVVATAVVVGVVALVYVPVVGPIVGIGALGVGAVFGGYHLYLGVRSMLGGGERGTAEGAGYIGLAITELLPTRWIPRIASQVRVDWRAVRGWFARRPALPTPAAGGGHLERLRTTPGPHRNEPLTPECADEMFQRILRRHLGEQVPAAPAPMGLNRLDFDRQINALDDVWRLIHPGGSVDGLGAFPNRAALEAFVRQHPELVRPGTEMFVAGHPAAGGEGHVWNLRVTPGGHLATEGGADWSMGQFRLFWVRRRADAPILAPTPVSPGGGRVPAVRATPAPDRLIRLAEQARPRYAAELEGAITSVRRVLGELGTVTGRAKDAESAANRLQRAIDRFGARVDTVDDVLRNLWDAVGTRVVLNDTSPAAVERVVDRLAAAIRSGELRVVEINNLHGPGGRPYFSAEQMARLQQVAADAGLPIRVSSSRVMDSGYTSVCVYLEHPGGVRGELQILGARTLEVANLEHIPYDVWLGKPLARNIGAGGRAELQRLVGPIEDVFRGMSATQRARYEAYLNQLYQHARSVELGIPSTAPRLPEGLPESVSVEALRRLEAAIAALRARHPV